MTKDRKEQVQFLLTQYVEGKASEREQELLFVYLNEGNEDQEWEALIEELMLIEPEGEKYRNMDWQPEIDKILGHKSVGYRQLKTPGKTKLFFIKYGRVAAAAAIILVLSITAFLLLKSNKQQVAQNHIQTPVVADIAPGGDRAILTLADGKQIVLDTASNGALTSQGGIEVIKLDGQLSYKLVGNASQVVYNTISTPKGGQYQLILADGTKVWLNALSSINFPTSFPGSDRKVEIKGEAYFEVAHDVSKPFIASVNGVDVQVLGTHFNINAYDDELMVRTTLLEGKVLVRKAAKSVILQPGQQAINKFSSGSIEVNSDVDVDDVIAWKEGYFNFEHSDINKILREFSRWYDIDVKAENISGRQQFFGIVNRNKSLASALKVLKAGGPQELNYQISGKTLIVTTNKR